MFHATISLILGVLALNIEPTFGTNQHLICKTVNDVFADGSSDSHIQTTPRLLHGPPGKRGQTGVKGEPGISGLKGEKGTPGIVDPQNVENLVEEKCSEGNRELRGRIVKLEEVVARMNSSTTGITDRLLCEEGFAYGSKCYFAIIPGGWHNLQSAQNLCSDKGGTPADILSLGHQQLVAEHVRSKSSGINWVWLGMTYTSSILRWSTGIIVPDEASIKWWSGYPLSYSGWDKIGFYVTSNEFGILNGPSTSTEHGVVCEK